MRSFIMTSVARTSIGRDRTFTVKDYIRDRSDWLWYAALALLPVDGTVFGVRMAYWSPIAPLLFLAYAVCNGRRSLALVRRHPALIGLPLVCLAVSGFGWLTVGAHPSHAVLSLLALLCASATFVSFALAWSVKRLPLRASVSVVTAAYGVAFAFGVFTWLIQPGHLDIVFLRNPLMNLYLRQYFVVRPQFLFAEPSYIGVHVFGVLLPLFWLSRDRRLPWLIGVFALGSVAMGCGVRIVLDCIVAAVVCLVMMVPWRGTVRRLRRRPRMMAAVVAGFVALCGAAAAMMAAQPRIRSILSHGLLSGDVSMSARLFRSLAPMVAALRDPWHLLFGFGAGNVGEAMARGYAEASAWYTTHGGMMTGEIAQLADPYAPVANRAGNVFTMDAYVSFITEFGLMPFVVACMLIVRAMVRGCAIRRTSTCADGGTVKFLCCWLLLLTYLYAQFEAYAFYALPLFLWYLHYGPQTMQSA
ncbi:hypothetical protein D2E24_0413 [Bifidobacterium samirii]|uniref:Uncharacterized protein n=2 Tax=Bifidobacterium samirii TaxID=2306974 RepID=A0A430FVS6_9BIFI|nr:hypothetical protein D2E24_0413 [Bifidobacterium samirii]